MIRINLLPEEYRKKARTPIKLLLGVTAAAAINGGLAAWWAWSTFAVAAQIDSEKTVMQTEMDGITPQLNYYHSLEGESKQYKSRETTLAAITKSRISWTRKLDELIDVVNRGGDGQRHLVWLDDLQVAQSADPSAKTPGSLHANGHSGSDKFAQVANFLEDLESSPFIHDFQPPTPPEGTETLVDETLVPPVAWAFPLSLSLKTAEERDAAEAALKARANEVKDKPAKDADKTGTPATPNSPAPSSSPSTTPPPPAQTPNKEPAAPKAKVHKASKVALPNGAQENQ